VGSTFDQAALLHEADHRRHRLLGEAGSAAKPSTPGVGTTGFMRKSTVWRSSSASKRMRTSPAGLLAGRYGGKCDLLPWLVAAAIAVLMAIVAPAVLQSGLAGLLAVAATATVVRRTGNLLLAMTVGVAVVWALRRVL
jgi:hypothetical protein